VTISKKLVLFELHNITTIRDRVFKSWSRVGLAWVLWRKLLVG